MRSDQTGPEEQETVRQQSMRYMPSFGGHSARKPDRSVDIFRYMMMLNYQMSRTASYGKEK